MSTTRTNVFISYAEADRKWLERLRVHLKPLELLGQIDTWDNTRVLPGRNWRAELSQALSLARVAVLLISSDFLASEFILNEELRPLWSAAQRSEITIIPVIVRPCLYDLLAELKELQPANKTPLTALSAPDAENSLAQVARTIQASLSLSGASGAASGLRAWPTPPVPQAGRRKAVILTALSMEYRAVAEQLNSVREMIHPSGTIYEQGLFAGSDTSWDIALVEVGMGNNRAAFEAERAFQFFAPEVALFIGIAGGIKDVEIGDVVVATKVYGYESGRAGEQFLPRPDVGETSYRLVQRARAEARRSGWLRRVAGNPTREPKVLVAPIAAGEKVVASTASSVASFLRTNYGDAVAVEMEGRGFLEAARANQQISALVVRGISDLLDRKTDAEKAGSQQLAARHASAFAFEILAHLGPSL